MISYTKYVASFDFKLAAYMISVCSTTLNTNCDVNIMKVIQFTIVHLVLNVNYLTDVQRVLSCFC